MKKMKWMSIILIIAAAVIAGCGQGSSSDTVRLDYAHYSPLSLVIREKGWAEEAFAEDKLKVSWVLSQGSNKALEFLNSNSIDLGSAAGAAALISKSKGAPIEGVYVANKPEWTALVTGPNSSIKAVTDLVGKKVAATVGTDPYIFLLRALDEAGVAVKDVEIVNLQHNDGATSLVTDKIDAWAGLDPHMARIELENQAQLFYRNVDFNTYGFLLARSDYVTKYPERVEKVLAVYERARLWTLENMEEATAILAKEANLSLEVARKQMERNDFASPIPGAAQRETIYEAGKVLQNNQIIKSDVNLDQLVDALLQPVLAEKVVKP